jgi:hypothetical protein
MNSYGEAVTIDVVKGGFILTYPSKGETGEFTETTREVLNSPGKLFKRVKEVIGDLSLVPADKE